MAFFENLGKRLTDAGQGVSQQAKNFADVTRLNGTISDKEKRITQLYTSIGQTYYQKHQNDPSAEEAQMIQSINTLLAEIDQCQEEIKQIRGVVRCSSCGAEVPLTAAFCNACGTRLSQTPEPPLQADTCICPQCHSAVSRENRFCDHCGAKLSVNSDGEAGV